MPNMVRGVALLLAASLCVSSSVSALAATPSRKDFGQVSQLVLNSFHLIQDKDLSAARAECEKARAISAKFSDPFIQATVAVCFGDVDDYENKQKSACQHFSEAMKLFKATPKKHPAQRALNGQIKTLQGKLYQLAC
jgi:hypothetical protein